MYLFAHFLHVDVSEWFGCLMDELLTRTELLPSGEGLAFFIIVREDSLCGLGLIEMDL